MADTLSSLVNINGKYSKRTFQQNHYTWKIDTYGYIYYRNFFCRAHSHVLFWGHWYPCFGFTTET